MTFTYIRDGKPEHVELKRWVWLALYKDGSYLMQFDETDKAFHQVSEIDQSKLDVFVMAHHADPSKRVEIHWKPHYQLICFTRNWRQDGMPAGEWIPLFNFGYKFKDATGRTQKFIMEITATDAIAVKDDDGRGSLDD